MIISGRVIKGDQKGHKQGFPTANLNPRILKHRFSKGVYACYINFKNKQKKGILIYGAPNIKGEAKLEVFFLKKPLRVYRKNISVVVIKKIRNLKKFHSKNEFFKQVKKDIKAAKKILTP